MKKLLFLFIATFTLLSCENDFDLTEDWKDVTVIYGLLDQSLPVQYIRIEKAFLDPTTSALVLAKEADSLYYDDIMVQLIEFQSGNSSGSRYELERVNAIDEGFTRVEGVFATTPNILYKLTRPIREDFTYRLEVIKNGDTENRIQATTNICEDFELSAPGSSATSLRFRPGSETSFRWSPQDNSKIFTLNLKINYKEAPISNPTNFATKELVWVLDNDITPGAGQLARVSVEGEAFFEFMAEALEPGFVRSIDSLDIEIISGAEGFLDYINAGKINSGITSSDVIDPYTNLNEDFIGLFSSRFYKNKTGYDLELLSLDSLKEGYRTRDLGF